MRRLATLSRVAFLTGALAVGACDPSPPTFGPPEPGIPGKIYAEQKAVTTAEGAVVVLEDGDVTVTFPPSALPAGTAVTVRLLLDVHKTLDGVEPKTWEFWYRPAAAIQIAPETLRLSDTVGIHLNRVLELVGAPQLRTAQLLFAAGDAPTWERRGTVTLTPAAESKATLPADRPGVWSLVFDAPEGRDAGAE